MHDEAPLPPTSSDLPTAPRPRPSSCSEPRRCRPLWFLAYALISAALTAQEPAEGDRQESGEIVSEAAAAESGSAAGESSATLASAWRVWFDAASGRLVSVPPEGTPPSAAAPVMATRPPQIRNFAFTAEGGRAVRGAFLDGAFQSAAQVHVHRRAQKQNDGPELVLTTTCRELHLDATAEGGTESDATVNGDQR